MSLSGRRLLLLIALIALAFNLRPAATSIGPVIGSLSDDLGITATAAGFLTTLPVLCFAIFGALAPWFSRRLGPQRVMLAALIFSSAGLLIRAELHSPALFLLVTLAPLAGMATANVLIPSLIKEHFPDRIGLLTALYTTTLAIGMTAAASLTVPIGEEAGSWRVGIAAWGLTAAIAVLPWLGVVRNDEHAAVRRTSTVRFGDVARTPLGWWMAAYFGLQSLHAYAIFGWLPEIYIAAGFSARESGLLLAVTTAVTMPVSFVLPGLAVRLRRQAPLVYVLGGCYVAGYVGLMFWPAAAALLWCVLVGLGTGAFPLVLTMLGLRSATADGTAALSGFTQSVGYLIAGIGPFMMGAVFDATGTWKVPLAVLIVLVLPLTWTGLQVARPQMLEDQLTDPTDPPEEREDLPA